MRLSTSSEAATSAADSPSLTPSEQRVALNKIWVRLIPLLFLCYVVAYIDRINVGFAKLHLQQALGVNDAVFSSVYGFGAGIFFIGYFIFEIPSNLILHRIGARIWIARILVLWGLVSAAFMFLSGARMFYAMRFLLGAAEAGFFPGVLLYFTYWYPARERAKIIALFAIGGVAAGVVGSPISGTILQHMDGMAGLHGWQWLFLVEAMPAVLLGVVVFMILPDNPQKSNWLTEREKNWVLARVAADAAASRSSERQTLGQVFSCGRVYLLCLIYFLMNIGSYGFEMWAPSIEKQLSGGSDAMVGYINAIPYFIAGVMMFLIARNSDRTGERRVHIAASALSAAIGFAISATAKNPVVAMAGLVIAFAGLKCTIAPFWALTTAFLSGAGAAGGIALINSVGNLGGYVGPHVVGLIKDRTGGSNFAALLFLGTALLGMALFTMTIPRPPAPPPHD
jgi:ACS family tartrate transporter-like MFS transporter